MLRAKDERTNAGFYWSTDAKTGAPCLSFGIYPEENLHEAGARNSRKDKSAIRRIVLDALSQLDPTDQADVIAEAMRAHGIRLRDVEAMNPEGDEED